MVKRLFAAVKIHPDVKFLQHLQTFRGKLMRDNIKWVEPGNIHVTLKFFGETPVEAIPGISEALRNACLGFGGFTALISQVGIFGSSYRPRVIWLKLEPAEVFQNLQQRIADQLEPQGYHNDRQNFVPHLTLGRINKIHDLKYFQETLETNREALHFKQPVTSLILYESLLQRTGPVYTVVEEFAL